MRPDLEERVTRLEHFMEQFRNAAEIDPLIAKTLKQIIGAVNLGDLGDVSSTVPTTNQVLKYNGTEWAPGTDIDT